MSGSMTTWADVACLLVGGLMFLAWMYGDEIIDLIREWIHRK